MATLYRKYRSQNFKEIIGQDYITDVLKQAVKEKRFTHAYLFAGPRGTGKTSTARILAKALNCLNPGADGEPCNKCFNCTAISNGRFLDLLEIDAASNRGIEEIRALKEKVNFLPVQGKVKMYIIDEVHMMTTEAFNALLKTLEEPPLNVIFVLATTEVHKIPLTIVSRTQKFDFRPADKENIAKKLKYILSKEKISFEEDAIEIIAEGGEGSFRDAETILEKVVTSLFSQNKKKINRELVEQSVGLVDRKNVEVFFKALITKDRGRSMDIFAKTRSGGVNLAQFIKQVIEYGRKIMLKYVSEKSKDTRQVLNILKELNNAANEMKYSIVTDLPFELAIISLTDNEDNEDNEEQEELGKDLEQEQEQGQVKEQAQKKEQGQGKEQGSEKQQKQEQEKKQAQHKRQEQKETTTQGQINIEVLMDKWQVFLNNAKQYNHFLGAILAKSVPETEEDEGILLKVPTAFHKKQIEKKDTRDTICDIFEHIYGMNVSFRCVIDRSLNQCNENEENFFDSLSNEKLVEEILL